jgi:hypothetical protein
MERSIIFYMALALAFWVFLTYAVLAQTTPLPNSRGAIRSAIPFSYGGVTVYRDAHGRAVTTSTPMQGGVILFNPMPTGRR